MTETDLMEIRNSISLRRSKLKQGGKLAFQLMQIRDKISNIMGNKHFENQFQNMLDDPFISIVSLHISTLKSLFGDEYYNLSQSEIDHIVTKLHDKLTVHYGSTLTQIVDEVIEARK